MLCLFIFLVFQGCEFELLTNSKKCKKWKFALERFLHVLEIKAAFRFPSKSFLYQLVFHMFPKCLAYSFPFWSRWCCFPSTRAQRQFDKQSNWENNFHEKRIRRTIRFLNCLAHRLAFGWCLCFSLY